MARHARVAPGGLIYHVLNRSAGRIRLFRKDADYEVFERIMAEAHERHPLRILAWCIMRNHWHFVIRPRKNGELTAFLRWLAHTHAMRWHVAHKTGGCGHLYPGRFKSFPVQADDHFLTVCRYVERNALTAKVVRRAEAWRWGSLWARHSGPPELKVPLSDWPVPRPRNWVKLVNEPMTAREVDAVRTSIVRSRPFGSPTWPLKTAGRLGLMHTIRSEGRPRNAQTKRAVADN